MPITQAGIHEFHGKVFCGLGGQLSKLLNQSLLLSLRQVRSKDMHLNQLLELILLKLDGDNAKLSSEPTILREKV